MKNVRKVYVYVNVFSVNKVDQAAQRFDATYRQLPPPPTPPPTPTPTPQPQP